MIRGEKHQGASRIARFLQKEADLVSDFDTEGGFNPDYLQIDRIIAHRVRTWSIFKLTPLAQTDACVAVVVVVFFFFFLWWWWWYLVFAGD